VRTAQPSEYIGVPCHRETELTAASRTDPQSLLGGKVDDEGYCGPVAGRTHRFCIFVERVEKPIDNSSARSLCHLAADAYTLLRRSVVTWPGALHGALGADTHTAEWNGALLKLCRHSWRTCTEGYYVDEQARD
jgi:hypothetical protein